MRATGHRSRNDAADAFDVVTVVNDSPIPREALRTGTIEKVRISDTLPTVEMPALVRRELLDLPPPTYPPHPGTPVWHYLVLGVAVACLVAVALLLLSSLGFAPLANR